MPGPKQLQKELNILQEDWSDLAIACGINPRKKSLSDEETERIRTAKNLLQQGEVSTYEQITEYFEQQPKKERENDHVSSSAVNNMMKKLISEAVNSGIVTGDLYSQVLQQAAKQRFSEKVISGELQHNLTQGFHNILFENGLTAQQLEDEGMKMIEQISESYEPQLLSASDNTSTVKMISGNFSDQSNRVDNLEDNSENNQIDNSSDVVEDNKVHDSEDNHVNDSHNDSDIEVVYTD